MTEVDQRVVQMRFDDQDFDEKAKKTMKTLDKLSEKLSFSAVAQKSDAALEEVVDNVEKMANQAYTIVDRVIDKIRDSIANKLVDFIKSATIDQVANGWRKYSDMTTAVGTLLSQGHKIEKVNKTLEDLSYFADETSYSFNDMLSGIAKFTAAGVGLDDAKVALMGISNWAAQSGQNAEVASRVFGQLAQAMGTYMKKQDWMSVQTANMDTQEFRQTALDTAVALGTLKKVGENTYKSLRATTKKGAEAFTINSFVESLTQGAWMTSEVMVETYKKYATAVEKIKEIYDSSDGQFTGTIIRQRREINRDLIEKYSQIYKVTEETAQKELDKWSTVQKATKEEIENYARLNKMTEEIADKKLNAGYYNAVAEYSKRTRKSIQETEKDLEQWSEYISEFSLKAFLNAQEARTFTDVINSVKESAASAWRTIYTSIFGDYDEAKALWTDLAEGLIDLFTNRLYKISEIFEEWKNDGGRNQMWRGLYAFGYGITMAIQNVRDAWDLLITDGESGVQVLSRISAKIEEAGIKFYGFVKALTDNGFFANIAETLHNIKSFIDSIFGAFYDGVRDAIPDGNFFLSLLVEFSSLLKDLSSNFKLSDEAIDGLRRTFKGLFIILNKSKKTLIDILVKIVLPVLNVVLSVFGTVVECITTITGAIGDAIEYFIPLNSETSAFVTILEFLAKVLTKVVLFATRIAVIATRMIMPVLGTLIGLVISLANSIASLFNGGNIKMGGETTKVGKVFADLKATILETWEPLKSLKEITDEYKDGKGFMNFLRLFGDITEGIGQRLLLTVDAVLGFIEVIGNSKLGKVLSFALSALRTLVRGAFWLFNNVLIPILKEVITEIGFTLESVKDIVEKDGILGLLDLIQEVFATGIVAKLMDTINLINTILGGNGLGKLFKKGANALEEIADYFNAAKLNQMADIMLKVIGAIGILYALLALITFLPEEKLDAMKERLLDFGLALGIVTGSMFLISASAHLAGTNLLGLAASFFGLGFAINIAFSSLEKMANFLVNFDETVVNNAIAKLEGILSRLTEFVFKAVLPFAGISIFGGEVSSSFWTLGVVFAGIAASIWLIIDSLKGLAGVNTNDIDLLSEFIAKIWLVLSGSIGLIILAAQGREVHGIGIAIAALATSLVALKVVFPLMKEIAASKGEFDGAIEAIGLFGAFMAAFAFSMFLIMKGSNGLLATLGSIIMLKVFTSALRKIIVPSIIDLITIMVDWANEMEETLAQGSKFKIWLIGMASVASLYALFVAGMAVLERTWGSVNPLTFLFIGATIFSVSYLISRVMIPAVEHLLGVVNKLSTGDIIAACSILLLMSAPLIAMSIMFSKVMKNLQKIYNGWRNFSLIKVNAGIVSKEFNYISSVMSSVMFSILGVYLSLVGILAVVGHYDWSFDKIAALVLLFVGAISLVGALAMIMVSFENLVASLSMLDKVTKSAQKIGAGLIYNNENTLSTVIRSVSGVLIMLLAVVGTITVGIGVIAGIMSATGKVNELIKVILSFGVVIAVLVGGTFMFLKYLTYVITMVPVGLNTAKVINAISGILLAVGAIFAEIILMGMFTTSIVSDKEKYEAFNNALPKMLVILGASLLMIGLFVKFIASSLDKFRLLTSMSTAVGENLYKSPAVDILMILAGVIGIITSIGLFLLPAVAELAKLDVSKVIITFIGILSVLLVCLGALAVSLTAITPIAEGVTNVNSIAWTSILKILAGVVAPIIAIGHYLLPAVTELAKMDFGRVFSILLATLGILAANVISIVLLTAQVEYGITNPAEVWNFVKIITGIIGPMIALSIAFYTLSKVLNNINTLDEDKLQQFKELFYGLLGIMGIGLAIGAVAGFLPSVATGIITVAAAIAIVIGAFSVLAKTISGLNNDLAEGIDAGFKDLNKTMEKSTETLVNTAYKVTGTNSPSKEMVKLGKYMDQGLALGITRNTKMVSRAATTLANVPVDTVETLLGIASPSKVFYKEGRFIVAGLAEGMKSQKSGIEDISASIGEAVKSGIEGIKIEAPDIFGGKDPAEYFNEMLGKLDAGSIVGKMFGLDTYEQQIEAYQIELDTINKNAAEQGGIDAGTARRASWLKNEIDRLTEEAKNKSTVERAFDKIFATDIIQKIGEKLGINLSSGATGQSVLDDFTNNFIGGGINDPNSIIGQIASEVMGSDWFSVGSEIGGAISDGIKRSGIGQHIMKVGNFFGVIDDEEYYDYLNEIGEMDDLERLAKKMKSEEAPLVDVGFMTIDDPFTSEEDYKNNIMAFINNMASYLSEQMPKVMQKYGGTIRDLLKYAVTQDLKRDDISLTDAQIVQAIMNGFTKQWHIGEEEIDGVVYSGINRLVMKVKKQLGIASPSKVAAGIMENVIDGAIVGEEENAPKLQSALEDMTDDQINTMSLAMQAMDEMASGTAVYTPKIVPTVDSASLNTSLNTVDSALRVDPAKVNSSLNVETDMNQLAQSQYAMAGAIDNLRNDILTMLSKGEFVKIDVETHTDDSAIYDSVVTINREKYNQTGINNMTQFA